MSEKLTYPCPGCKKELKLSLEETKPGKSVKCPSCGAVLDLKGDDMTKLLESAQADFSKNFSKKFKIDF